jgi:rubrerythrin
MRARLVATPTATPLADEARTFDRALDRIATPSAPRFDRSLYSPEAVAAVAAQWRFRMAFEHRSSMVFSQLAQQLYEANASLDAKIVMLRMASDELRHTGTCAEVIEALAPEAGPATVEVDLEVQPLARHGNATPEERALRNVIYTTCLSEMVACARFVATLDRTDDPFLRDAMRRLLADEVLHGQFGFHYLGANQDWLAAHGEVRASIERYLVHAFAVIEEELAPKPPFAELSDEAKALGADDFALAREVFYGTMEGAIVPGLEQQGLAAAASWKARKRLA